LRLAEVEVVGVQSDGDGVLRDVAHHPGARRGGVHLDGLVVLPAREAGRCLAHPAACAALAPAARATVGAGASARGAAGIAPARPAASAACCPALASGVAGARAAAPAAAACSPVTAAAALLFA